MKAPDKIYLAQNILGDVIEGSWQFHKLREDDIEYTRTDAFIEKACNYLSYHLDTSRIGVNYKFDFIEEFRKAMKL